VARRGPPAVEISGLGLTPDLASCSGCSSSWCPAWWSDGTGVPTESRPSGPQSCSPRASSCRSSRAGLSSCTSDRIACEIHDVLAHSLVALGIQIQVARRPDRSPGRRSRGRDSWHGVADGGRGPVGDAPGRSRPAHRHPAGRRGTRAGERYPRTRYGVAASFDTGGTPRPPPPDATTTLLRIARESLVNAAKHAAGQPVAVRFDYHDADVGLALPRGRCRACDLNRAEGQSDIGTITETENQMLLHRRSAEEYGSAGRRTTGRPR
jgi:Histidine kinase